MELKEIEKNTFEIVPTEGREILWDSLDKKDCLIVLEMDPSGEKYEIHFNLVTWKVLNLKERKQTIPKTKIIKYKKHKLYLEIKHKIEGKGNIEYVYYFLRNLDTGKLLHSYGKGEVYGQGYDDPKEILEAYLRQKDPSRFFRLEYSKYSLKEKIDYWEADICFFGRITYSGEERAFTNILIFYLEKKFYQDLKKYDKEPVPTNIIKGLAKRFKVKQSIALKLCELESRSDEWIEAVKKAGYLNEKIKKK